MTEMVKELIESEGVGAGQQGMSKDDEGDQGPGKVYPQSL